MLHTIFLTGRYLRCWKNAWPGSWDRANALATIVGVFVVWIVTESIGYHVIVPESLQEVIFLALICLVAAWVVVFFVRFIVAPVRRYTALEAQQHCCAGERAVSFF
jgi:hypothetical protein